jgi:hypothetical protein
MTLRPIVTLWVEGTLGPIERLSLKSFVAQGHPTTLYAYGDIRGLPEGVELRDARSVLPEAAARENRYPNGSYALFSNLFRYELLRLGLGIWCDTDIVCLRPIALDLSFIAGRETERFINGAVLYADPGSGFVADALEAFRNGRIPPWVSLERAPGAYLRQLLRRSVAPTDLPHGTFGPKAVTALAKRHALDRLAQPEEVFYPVHPRQALSVFEPGSATASPVTERTLTVHLWNEKLRAVRNTTPPPGSLLRELYERFGV